MLRLRPEFIALAETHLSGEPLQMFLPAGYIVAARHDRTCHGGGVLLLCRDHLFVNTLDRRQYYVSGTSEIIGVLCQGTVIVCLYRQPSRSDLTLIDSLTEFRSAHSHHPLIVVGDFNVQEQEWLGSPYTSSVGSALRGFCEAFGLRQLIDQGTRQGAVLDLIITEYAASVTYHPHLGSSDHIGLFVKFNLNLQEPPPLVSRRVYHWASALWNHIRGHFRHVQWDVLRSGTRGC